MKKLKKRVQETASKASGQLKKGLAAKAKSLESVLADIKSRDFLQSAKMQDLMAKVTVKGLNSVPFIKKSQKPAKEVAKPKTKTSESAFSARLKTLEGQINSQVARDLILTIMKRADEIKQAYFSGETADGAAGEPKRASARKDPKAQAGTAARGKVAAKGRAAKTATMKATRKKSGAAKGKARR